MRVLVQITTYPEGHPEHAELVREFVMENKNYDAPEKLASDAQMYLEDMATVNQIRCWVAKKWHKQFK
jgi:hypothetical protein